MRFPRGTNPLHAAMIVPRGALVLAALLMAGISLGCDPGSDLIAGTDVPEVRFDKPSCPHPSCGDEPAPAGNATVDLTGNVTASSQEVVISKDSRNQLAGSGAGEDFSIVDALDFSGDLGVCVTDPPDLDAAAVTRLTQRLVENLSRSRTFRFTVNRKDPDNMHGGINQTWLAADGHQYRVRVTESSLRPGDRPVVESTSTGPNTVEYEYSEGSIVSWDTTTDEALACDYLGSVTMALTR